jgi:hypothetical protein
MNDGRQSVESNFRAFVIVIIIISLLLLLPWNAHTPSIDLGSPNCERMTPIKFTEYVQEYFKSQSVIKTSVVEDINVIEKEYPLLHAVARCSLSGMCLLSFILVLLFVFHLFPKEKK